ncbi:MAG: hypothetical protein ACR2PR_01730 [Pseudohongiellaceae bacterium]
MEAVEALTFSFATMVQIVTLVVAAAGSWFYLRSKFESNATALNHVTTTLTTLDKKLDKKFDAISTDMEKQSKSIIKIEAHGSVMEERISNLSERVNAMAGPRR